MAGQSAIVPTPADIGVTPEAAFAVLPDPETMFEARAARFRSLAEGHALGDYLKFLAGLSQIQHEIQPSLPEPTPPSLEALDRAFEFGMPPIDRGRFVVDEAARASLARLLDGAVALETPEPASRARARLASDPELQAKVLAEALEGASAIETLAEHVFASAALQVHFARLAARLDAGRVKPVGTGACPCCGGPPVASLVVDWASAHGVRYVSCALCGTLWNHVRVKCVVCDSTKGVSYRALAAEEEEPKLERGSDRMIVKAETCDECRCYVKIMQQHLDTSVDPMADDVATLGLDIKVREAGWARAAFNPYLLGY